MADIEITQDVTRADREAAYGCCLPSVGESLANWADVRTAIADGKIDDHYLVQAFARHRQAVIAQQIEKDAKLAEGMAMEYAGLREGVLIERVAKVIKAQANG